MVHTVGIVMPLSAKATSHCPSLTFIIQTISPHQGTDPPACRGLPCAAIQYPEQPLCSACFAHFSTSVSSPVETVLKAAFHSRNISHLTVFNINLFFFFCTRFHNAGRRGSLQHNVCSMGLSHLAPHQLA